MQYVRLSVKILIQCFSTFFLKQNLPQMFTLLMEPYAMIQVSILLAVINECRQGNFDLF